MEPVGWFPSAGSHPAVIGDVDLVDVDGRCDGDDRFDDATGPVIHLDRYVGVLGGRDQFVEQSLRLGLPDLFVDFGRTRFTTRHRRVRIGYARFGDSQEEDRLAGKSRAGVLECVSGRFGSFTGTRSSNPSVRVVSIPWTCD